MRFLFAMVVALAGAAPPAMAQRAMRALSDCNPVHVTVDTTGASLHIPFDQGRGYGEIILAADTLVTSVTFWIAHQYDNVFMQGFLFITAVDSSGISAHYPWTTNVIYASQLVTPPVGDGVHLRPFSFTLTPPAALPKPGAYFFLLSEGTCFGGILLLAQDNNPYPNGQVWETGTSDCSGRGPGTPTYSYPLWDLCMDLTFCDTHSTPVLRGTWGELKTRYH